MRKLIITILIAASLCAGPSALQAHIVNDQNLYEDITLSEAKEKIVYLSGLGVIAADHGVALFKPKDKLTRLELGFWAGAFHKLKGKTEDAAGIAAAALEQGIVASLQGNATFSDVSRAYFQGQVEAAQPDSELTREAFALFVGEHGQQKINGQSLFDKAGASSGPSGTVEAVTVREVNDNSGKSGKVYTLQINGISYVLSAHPKIVNSSVDPAVWEGKLLQESWLMKADGEEQQLHLLTFGQPQQKNNSNLPGSAASATHAGHVGHTDSQASENQPSFPVLPAVGGLLLVSAVIWLFAKRR